MRQIANFREIPLQGQTIGMIDFLALLVPAKDRAEVGFQWVCVTLIKD